MSGLKNLAKRVWFGGLEALHIRHDLVARHCAAKGNRTRNGGDWAGALIHYEEAVRLHPELVTIWIQLGHAYKEVGRSVDSFIAYYQAAKRAPEDPDAAMHYSRARHALGNSQGDALYGAVNPTLGDDFDSHPLDISSDRLRAPHVPFYADPRIKTKNLKPACSSCTSLPLGDIRLLTQGHVRNTSGLEDGIVEASGTRVGSNGYLLPSCTLLIKREAASRTNQTLRILVENRARGASQHYQAMASGEGGAVLTTPFTVGSMQQLWIAVSLPPYDSGAAQDHTTNITFSSQDEYHSVVALALCLTQQHEEDEFDKVWHNIQNRFSRYDFPEITKIKINHHYNKLSMLGQT